MTDLSHHKYQRGPIRTPTRNWRRLGAARKSDVIATMLLDARSLREAGHVDLAEAWTCAAELLRAMDGGTR